MRPSSTAAWLAAIRPKTLSLSVSPVLVGSAAAYAEAGELNWLIFIATAAAAMLIQIGTNLHNDAEDFEKGTDSENRLGPPRAVAQGWLQADAVRRGAFISFILAFLLGVYLVYVGGWPILLLGLCSLAAGAAYSAGPWPISHSPLGELFVYLFFGLAAVMGSYYLQSGELGWSIFLLATVIGLIAAAVLVVNNYRDRETDAVAGRRTLAVVMPEWLSRLEYAVLVFLPYLLVLLLPAGADGLSYGLLTWILLPWAVALVLEIYRYKNKSELNNLLANTARMQLMFSLLLSLALILRSV